MLKFWKLICVFTLFIFIQGFAQVIQITKTEEIISHFKDIDENDLVLFDVDMVLTQPKDSAFQVPNMKYHYQILKELIKDLNPIEKDIFVSLLVSKDGSEIVDNQLISILHELQLRQIKTLAITAILTGSLEYHNNLEEWRVNTLRSFNIDFSQSFSNHKDITFDNFSEYRGNYACFKQGIIFSNGEKNPSSKGDVLLAFLEKINFHPKKVMLIDDKYENLTKVQKALQAKMPETQFIGFYYRVAKEYPSKIVSEEYFEDKFQNLIKEAKEIAKKN